MCYVLWECCSLFGLQSKIVALLEISRSRYADQQLNRSIIGRTLFYFNSMADSEIEKTHNTRLHGIASRPVILDHYRELG